jgi:putative endonuclease
MTAKNLSYGKEGEILAAKHLIRNGYQILERNFKTRMGEIDIIARNDGYLVFVEVKARQSDNFGGPASAMTLSKQRKLNQMAKAYMAFKNVESNARFDVVLIHGSLDSVKIELIQNAFEMIG